MNMNPKALLAFATLPVTIAISDPDSLSPVDSATQIANRQIVCIEEWRPVCGSDRKIYSNACEAEAAGLRVLYDIKPPNDNLVAGSDCDVEQPSEEEDVLCMTDWTPVCGADGKVYSNACEAGVAGFDVLYEIESPDDGLTSGADCDKEAPSESIAIACTGDWTPVCGVNGKVYGNACEAGVDGQDVAFEIKPPNDNLLPGVACEAEERIDPIVCPTEWKPVCGSDGQVYSNACFVEVEAGGVDVLYEIESPDEGLATGDDCDESPDPDFYDEEIGIDSSGIMATGTYVAALGLMAFGAIA